MTFLHSSLSGLHIYINIIDLIMKMVSFRRKIDLDVKLTDLRCREKRYEFSCLFLKRKLLI